MKQTIYHDRTAAGQNLARKLRHYKGCNGVVLAVPRGGVPVAYEVARELELPMELILSKKIGHPSNKEYAIGAVSLHGSLIVNHPEVSATYIQQESARIRSRLQEMRRKFAGNRAPMDLKGKTVIVIDDGIATGSTLLGTVQILRKSAPARIVLAVPVASREALFRLSTVADEVVCPLVPEVFYGVGAHYADFEQVPDEAVLYYMEKLRPEATI